MGGLDGRELTRDRWRGARRLLSHRAGGVALGEILALTVAGQTYIAVRSGI